MPRRSGAPATSGSVQLSSTGGAGVGGRMLLMRQGRMVAEGYAAAFAARDLLTEAYFGDTA